MHNKKTCATRSIFDRYDQESRKQKDEDFDCEKNRKLVKLFL